MTQEQLVQKAIEFDVARNYFSDILNAQVVIFSVIVAALVGLYFFFNRTQNKQLVEEIVEKMKEDLRKRLEGDFQRYRKEVDQEFVKQKNRLQRLSAEQSRSIALIASQANLHTKAFIWWLSNAAQLSVLQDRGEDDERKIRIALTAAKRRLSVIPVSNLSFEPEEVGRYQYLINKISDEKFKIEKGLIKSNFEKIINSPSK